MIDFSRSRCGLSPNSRDVPPMPGLQAAVRRSFDPGEYTNAPFAGIVHEPDDYSKMPK